MSYQLGAIELIELGRPRPLGSGGRPFLSNRRALGDALSSAAAFVANALATLVNVIAEIVAVPVEVLVSGVGVIFENVSAVLRQIPLVGELVAQAILAAGAILKWAIRVPQLALEKIADLFEGLSSALEANFGETERSNLFAQAKEKIVARAAPESRDQVGRMVTPERDDVRGSGPDALSNAVKIGAGAAVAIGALALVT